MTKLRTNIPAEFLGLGYVLLRKIGTGATAEIFEARQIATSRRVALKISRNDIPMAEQVVQRMQTEWNVGRGLRHPHLVSIFDGGTFSDGRAWLAMERLVGHDLQSVLDAETRLEPSRALHIIRQVCEGLDVLHRRGAVHRDIKPENIFLASDGHLTDHVKLIDLGILSLPDDDPDRSHQMTGQIVLGAPLYLAPEQATDLQPDARADLYAVGGVLYHLLAGCPPFGEGDPVDVIEKHLNEAVLPIDSLVEDLPTSLVDVIHQCLEKDRERRPPSAEALINLLDDAGSDLAGDVSISASLRSAPMPEIPPVGHVNAWIRMAERQNRLIQTYWPDEVPQGLADARAVVETARAHLELAHAEAQKLRAYADEAASSRIRDRQRMAQQVRRLRKAIERFMTRLSEVEAAREAAVSTLEKHDDLYVSALKTLRESIGATVLNTPLGAFAARHREVDDLLTERGTLLKAVEQARADEAELNDTLTTLYAEEAEQQHAISDQELEEQEDGLRAEQRALTAATARVDAERHFEQAILRLLLEYAQAI